MIKSLDQAASRSRPVRVAALRAPGATVRALALAISFPTVAQAAPPSVSGIWDTARGATVELAPCGRETVCGTLVSSPAIRSDPAALDRNNKNPALRGRSLKGLRILVGLKKVGSIWTAGKIYNPEDGKTYGASIEALPDSSLRVKGCTSVFGASFCGLQQWRRGK